LVITSKFVHVVRNLYWRW